jgi:hypothetical protein
MYDSGRQNSVQAYFWSNHATSGLLPGNARYIAVLKREMATEIMTAAQIVETQRLEREWKPKIECN